MTVKEIIEGISNSETLTELDERRFMKFLQLCGFPRAIVTCGILYMEGRGTMEYPPMSIQSCAKMFLDVYSKKQAA